MSQLISTITGSKIHSIDRIKFFDLFACTCFHFQLMDHSNCFHAYFPKFFKLSNILLYFQGTITDLEVPIMVFDPSYIGVFYRCDPLMSGLTKKILTKHFSWEIWSKFELQNALWKITVSTSLKVHLNLGTFYKNIFSLKSAMMCVFG